MRGLPFLALQKVTVTRAWDITAPLKQKRGPQGTLAATRARAALRLGAMAVGLVGLASFAVAGTSPKEAELTHHKSLAVIDAAGTVHLPPIEVPLSPYMSEQAKKQFIHDFQKARTNGISPNMSIAQLRRAVDSEYFLPKLARIESRFHVKVQKQIVGGVRVLIVTPEDGVPERNKNDVLINLHGGGFQVGSGAAQLIESIPIAAVGKFKVVSVDYRMAPEYHFPAASKDVAAVYRSLLEKYRPKSIGVYGCSAGGELTGEAAAWFERANLPMPAALGIFGAGVFADPIWNGTSIYVNNPLAGGPVVPVTRDSTQKHSAMQYFEPSEMVDPLASPGQASAILSEFPPTLIITGTRSIELSVAVETQRLLTNAGVDADLHVWPEMTHCFIYDANLPEAEEAYGVIVRFFNEHLGQSRLDRQNSGHH